MGNAVICPGHAVYLSGDVHSDSSWVLQHFQSGEPPYYIGHLRRAVELAAADPDSWLILSGGVTRREAGTKSEAQGYLEVAGILEWFGTPEMKNRVLLEDYSRDSLENLLLGICAFKDALGAYPQHITVAGWAFKEERFRFHAQSIGLPASAFTYVGVNNPADLEPALAGERLAMIEFRNDPLGIGEGLQRKRAQRNPLNRQQNYTRSCPEMAPFLDTITFAPRRHHLNV